MLIWNVDAPEVVAELTGNGGIELKDSPGVLTAS